MGTPPIRSELITGITPHEQKGLNAPITVAKRTETIGLLPNALVMYLEVPDRLIMTESGIVITRYGQM